MNYPFVNKPDKEVKRLINEILQRLTKNHFFALYFRYPVYG